MVGIFAYSICDPIEGIVGGEEGWVEKGMLQKKNNSFVLGRVMGKEKEAGDSGKSER